MAEYLSGISGALAQTFSARLRRQWNRVAVTASRLEMVPATGQGGGKNIGWDVEFSGATSASFAEGSDVAASEYNTDPILPAVLPFGMYRSPFQLSNLEIKAAQASVANAAELGRIVVERLDGSLAKMASIANADLISGVGTDSNGNPIIFGLTNALAATGAYAGLNKSTWPEWQGNFLGNGGVARALTFGLLYQADQLVYTASGKTAKVIIASPGVYASYANLFETIKRVMVGPDGKPIGGPTYTGGEEELFWKGMPVIRDRNMPTGTMLMLNTDDIKIRPLAGAANDDGVQVSTRQLPSDNGETRTPTPLMVDVYPLARTGSAQKFVAEMYLQLQVERVNSHCIIQDILET
jgi:hypothetical protein